MSCLLGQIFSPLSESTREGVADFEVYVQFPALYNLAGHKQACEQTGHTPIFPSANSAMKAWAMIADFMM